MEIKRIGENQFRCALTEEEIQQMGFDIDEIISNTETTQQFMRVVLNIVEEQEHIDIDSVSTMVKAELMQDHSMAITFGGSSDVSFRNLVDTVSDMISKIDPEKLKQLQKDSKSKQPMKAGPMVVALCFHSLDEMIAMSKVCFPEKMPHSSLYKFENAYYLLLDFTGFSKEEMRPFALGTVEFDDGHCSDMSQIAYIREHGSCILAKQAIERLLEL